MVWGLRGVSDWDSQLENPTEVFITSTKDNANSEIEKIGDVRGAGVTLQPKEKTPFFGGLCICPTALLLLFGVYNFMRISSW